MKKKILTIIMIVSIVILCSCGSIEKSNSNEKTGDPFVKIFVDKKTGVNYFICEGMYDDTIVLRVNADGTPYVSDN